MKFLGCIWCKSCYISFNDSGNRYNLGFSVTARVNKLSQSQKDIPI
jgi:hypothetical protein